MMTLRSTSVLGDSSSRTSSEAAVRNRSAAVLGSMILNYKITNLLLETKQEEEINRT